MTDEQPTWWTKAEAIKHLGITRQTLSGYITSGAVAVYGQGREKLVRREEVQAEYRRRALRKKTGRWGHANHYVMVACTLPRALDITSGALVMSPVARTVPL